MEYAVKEIRGYPDEGDTWEPIENLKDAHDAIEEFLGNDTPTLHAQRITISCHITIAPQRSGLNIQSDLQNCTMK